MATKKDTKGTGGGTATAEKTPLTAPTSSVELPTTPEQYQEFNDRMEGQLALPTPDVEFLGTAQRSFDRIQEQITRLQADAQVYKTVLDHFGSAGR
jgi:hypothetical protein